MLPSSAQELTQSMLHAIEEEMQQVVQMVNMQSYEQFYEMMAYHLGWQGEGAGPKARGKRFRPQLVLLTCACTGNSWEKALPAAAAVELLHNFSLIHDDIEDDSPLRRGRETVWKKWGIPQAINTGDAMLTLAHLALFRLGPMVQSQVVIQAANLLQETCLKLTQGQHLDIAFENIEQVSLTEYWQMVEGKTAALLSACTELGALIGGADEVQRQYYKKFGYYLGLAFQAQDDLLGIWGDAALTGKSTESDLINRKKSLPTLYGLSQNGDFARRWNEGKIEQSEIPQLAAQLEREGGLSFTQQETVRLTELALENFHKSNPQEPARRILIEIANKLINRKG